MPALWRSWAAPPQGVCRAVRLPSAGSAHLLECRLLDLTDTLGAHSDRAAELAERALGALEAVAGAEDHPLALAEALEQMRHLGCQTARGELVVCVLPARVAEHVADRRAPAAGALERLLEAARLALGDEQSLKLGGAQLRD